MHSFNISKGLSATFTKTQKQTSKFNTPLALNIWTDKRSMGAHFVLVLLIPK